MNYVFDTPGAHFYDAAAATPQEASIERELGVRAPRPRAGTPVNRTARFKMRVEGATVASVAFWLAQATALAIGVASFVAAPSEADASQEAPERVTESDSAGHATYTASEAVDDLDLLGRVLASDVDAPPGFIVSVSKDHEVVSWRAAGVGVFVELALSIEDWHYWTVLRDGDHVRASEPVRMGRRTSINRIEEILRRHQPSSPVA